VTVPAGELVGRLLELLTPDHRTSLCFPWESPERTRWTYTPGSRPGLALRELGEPTRAAALELLRSALSPAGFASARAVMALEAVLRQLEERAGVPGSGQRHPSHYWFAVFGDPEGEGPWGWRVGGHHLNVHVTVVDGAQVVLPLFLGANPATAPDGSRSLGEAEDLGRELLVSLDDRQRGRAVLCDEAPSDILTGDATRAELTAVPVGVAFADLAPASQARLAALLDWYAGRADPPATVRTEEATFAWLGSTLPGEPHYYAVRAGRLLVELDNTQDGANHVHTVLRDVDRDWGEDLLSSHYQRSHR
jgi:hypothetical protein